jgi:AraC-like DNA-binding protein
MTGLIHRVEQHRASLRGIEAMTLVSNHHFPRHAHDQFGFGMIASGVQRSWSCVGQIEASAGDVIFCNPGEMHDGIPVEGRARRWTIIYFEPALVNRAVEEEIGSDLQIVRPVARDALLAQNFARLFASLTAPRPDSLCQEEELVRALACILQKNSARRPPFMNGPSPSIAKVLQKLNSAPDQPVSLAELATLAGLNRFQLLRAFTRQIGATPHAYLLQKRVSIARKLLASGVMPAAAAADAGFADQSHMSRAFLRYVGVTPARYRAALA